MVGCLVFFIFRGNLPKWPLFYDDGVDDDDDNHDNQDHDDGDDDVDDVQVFGC